MSLDPIAIATRGYVCNGAPDPISIALQGYECITGLPPFIEIVPERIFTVEAEGRVCVVYADPFYQDGGDC